MKNTAPDGISYKRKRTLHLWNEQKGICWICGHPMLKPDIENPKRKPNRWGTTIDHLKPNDKSFRHIKAAHLVCNNTRHHKGVDEIATHIVWVGKFFSNRDWLMSSFGKKVIAQWEKANGN